MTFFDKVSAAELTQRENVIVNLRLVLKFVFDTMDHSDSYPKYILMLLMMIAGCDKSPSHGEAEAETW